MGTYAPPPPKSVPSKRKRDFSNIDCYRAAIPQPTNEGVLRLRLGDVLWDGQPSARRRRVAKSDRWLAPTALKMSPLSGLRFTLRVMYWTAGTSEITQSPRLIHQCRSTCSATCVHLVRSHLHEINTPVTTELMGAGISEVLQGFEYTRAERMRSRLGRETRFAFAKY